ncbi:MAG: hypothetical protein IKN04_22825 [Clostridia bacterium]|nr:hypothetical protein [Clostridia bacterium]
MICVYPADCTDFSTNGNGALSPLIATVTETLNGEYELSLVYPIDEAGKWQRLVEGCIIRAPVPAAMTPRVKFTAPGDDTRTEVWRIHTDFAMIFLSSFVRWFPLLSAPIHLASFLLSVPSVQLISIWIFL